VVGARIREFRCLGDVVVPFGKFTVLLGANGSGKSTILEALGREPHSEGEEERALDPRPRVTWYCRLGEGEVTGHPAMAGGTELDAWLREEIASGFDDRLTADRIAVRLRKLFSPLVLALPGDGDPLRIVFHRWLHHVANPPRWMCDLAVSAECRVDPPLTWVHGALREMVGPIPVDKPGTPSAGVPDKKARAAAGPDASAPWLVELAELPGARLLHKPMPVTVYADPDDVTEPLTRHLPELALDVWSPLRAEGEPFEAALSALDHDALEPARRAGLLKPVLDEVERRLNRLLPEFVSAAGPVRLTIIEGPDDVSGEALSALQRLRDDCLGTGTDTDGQEGVVAALDHVLAILRTRTDTIDAHLDVVVDDPFTRAPVPFSHLGRGTRRWIVAALQEACRGLELEVTCPAGTEPPTVAELREHVESGTLPLRNATSGGPAVFLVDEPSESLQPRAVPDVLDWLEEQAGADGVVVLSSHSPLVMRGSAQRWRASTGRPGVVVAGVSRDGGTTTVTPIEGDLIGRLESLGDRLGISVDELLLIARGLLLVEGADDVKIIRRLYGRMLQRELVLVHAIGGSDIGALKSMLGSDVLRRLHIPVRVLLDKTSDPDDDVNGEWQIIRDGETPEQGAVGALASWCDEQGLDHVQAIPFAPDDIICGIGERPIRHVFAARLRTDPFLSWPEEYARFSADKEKFRKAAEAEALRKGRGSATWGLKQLAFKDWFVTRVGMTGEGNNAFAKTVDRLLEVLEPKDSSGWLEASMARVFASLTQK